MKHLRKYNENLDVEEVKNYISECFIDFIDNGAKVIYKPGSTSMNYLPSYEIVLKVPNCWFDPGETLSDNKKSAEILLEFYSDIENCLEKVNIKYPDFKQEYITDDNGHLREVIILFI